MGNKAIISKDNILEVAFAIASEKGLVGLGIREVADACSVSVGSVYNYFPSKAHLISEVVGRYWEQALDKTNYTQSKTKTFFRSATAYPNAWSNQSSTSNKPGLAK